MRASASAKPTRGSATTCSSPTLAQKTLERDEFAIELETRGQNVYEVEEELGHVPAAAATGPGPIVGADEAAEAV